MVGLLASRIEGIVELIHGWDDSGDTCGILGKKECCFFVLLLGICLGQDSMYAGIEYLPQGH